MTIGRDFLPQKSYILSHGVTKWIFGMGLIIDKRICSIRTEYKQEADNDDKTRSSVIIFILIRNRYASHITSW